MRAGSGGGDNTGINFAGWTIGLAVLVFCVLPVLACWGLGLIGMLTDATTGGR